MANKYPLIDISVKSIFQYFALGLVIVVISQVPDTWGTIFILARGLLAILLLLTIVMPIRPAVLLLFILAIAGQDIVSFGELAEYSTASIWQMRVGPINPSWIIFGCLLIQLLKTKKKIVPPPVRRAILWFATVPVAAGIVYGGFFSDQAGIEVVVDLKFALMLIASIVLFLSVFHEHPHYLVRVLAAFAGVLLARHLVDLIYLVANIGPIITTGVSRGSEDSAKGGVVFLIFLGIILIWGQKHRFVGMAITVPGIILLAAYGTRYLWITFVFGTIVLLLLLGLRRSVLILSIVAVLTVGGAWALFMANPESAKITLVRFQTLTEGRPLDSFAVNVDYNIISRIDQVRYAQLINVFDSIRRRYAYLWGTGYGGYYEDSVAPFPIGLKSSFEQYSLDAGRYYRTHSYTTHIFLKYGLVGLFIISALWLIPGYGLFKIFRKRNMFETWQPRMLNGTMLCMAAFLLTAMLQTYWSGKGLFINGMIIAACMEFARHYPAFTTAHLAQNMQERMA